ncbi:MarR family winged helix-turn-helix transcriptional regulator [Sulfurivermis fontis]|uniref:MarR family winged helix-turn-helix transcriptional regulator n=1 Tax=Sulfurivermis fontis TaxID=1972068 RepID=UPI000FD89887|nr:MarR family transcriptional regulator [Sulfurivermis fontis]
MKNATPHSRAGGLFTELVLETFRFNGRLIAAGDAMSAPLGLTSARWQVLGAIALDDKALTVADIARRMGLKRQSVQRLADALVEEGLLLREDNPAHRRAPLHRLSKAGERAYRTLDEQQAAWAAECAQGIPAQRLADALAVIRALRERLEVTSER